MAFQHDLSRMRATLDEADADNWFVAQLRPNGAALAERNLARQGFAAFFPGRMENHRGKMARKPLFPGYMFVRFDPCQPGWQAINSTRGITRLILNDIRSPSPLPAQFMGGLLARCANDGLILPPDEIAVGDRIRVISGPFADLVTTVDSLDQDQRLRILVDLMGQRVRTSIPSGQVEKLD